MKSAKARKSILVLVASTLALGLAGLASQTAGAGPSLGSNPYPYPKSTYWAWQNRPDLPANLGPASEWARNAEAQGWPVSLYPRKGDIAVFQPGVYDAVASGHVAVVEQVLEDGQFNTSEMDEHDCVYDTSTCGQVHRSSYTLVKGISFVHYLRDTRTTWGFNSGAAGWTGHDLGAGNMGGPGWYYPLAGADPQLVSPELEIPLESYVAVEVEMAAGVPVVDPTMQVYFATDEAPGFSESRSVKVTGKADGQARTYRFDFLTNPAWRGTLTRLRLDPAGGGTTGGVRVDRVRLVPIGRDANNVNAYFQPDSHQAAAGGRPGR